MGAQLLVAALAADTLSRQYAIGKISSVAALKKGEQVKVLHTDVETGS